MKHLLLFALLAVGALADPAEPTATLELTANSPNTLTDGGTLTFTASAADFPADTSALAWTVTLPSGWAYVSGSNEPDITPNAGTTILLEWAYIEVPSGTATFTFQVAYPGDVLMDSSVSAEVILRTQNTGEATLLPVDAVAFTPVPSRANDITFPGIADQQANSPSFDLAATSPSGLPITYTVVSGPALIAGNTVTLTGAAGEVVIRADQGGDLYYLPAPSVTQTFQVVQSGPLVYFGTATDGTSFAVNIPEGSTTGTLFGSIPNGQFYILTFQVNTDRSITALNLQLLGTPTTAALALAQSPLRTLVGKGVTPPTTAGALEFTFTGTLSNGQLNFQIAELGVTLTGVIEPPEGPTAPLAGLYEASSLNNANGTTTSIVGTTGKVYVLAITPTIITGGQGTIASSGVFNLTTAQNVTIQGNVDAPSTTLTGTLILADGTEDPFQGLSTQTLRTDRMINLSTRAYLDAANGTDLVTGFVIGGTESKRVLLRAVGPTLEAFGITTAVADPSLTVYNGAGEVVTQVDDWAGNAEVAAAMALTGAFTLDSASLDAAYVTDLDPGVYTMRVSNDSSPGIALAEIYDASENPNSQYQRLINISSRGNVVGGQGVLVGGFIVTGNSPKRMLVRGVGPGLLAHGLSNALHDPQLKVYNADEQIIAANDNWQSPQAVFTGQRTAAAAEITAANTTTGAFQLGEASGDSALIITLSPGAYTVELSSTDSTAGTALIEVYEIPE